MGKLRRPSQAQRVLAFLNENPYITDLLAADMDPPIHSLQERIRDLRESGHDIYTEMVYEKDEYGNPTRYGKYYLRGVQREGQAPPLREGRSAQ